MNMKHLKLYEEFSPIIDNLFYKFSYVHKGCGKGSIWNPNKNACQNKLDFINDLINDGLIETDKPMDKYLMTEIVNILYRCGRIFKDGYAKSLHSRYKEETPEITELLDLIARETKYGLLNRAKPAIESWFKFITPIVSEVNKRIWIESAEGRKWATDLGKFEVYCELLIDLESTEAIQVKLDMLSSKIFFYGNQTRIKEYSEKDIMAIVAILKSYPTIRVEILGWHNTPTLSPGNELLDVRRANAVKDMLVSKGIDESRMTAEGKGESTVVPTTTQKNEFGDDWNKNMRVDIKIIK
jgi:outer membrane protein OmpA-like peptidoglycan-associated protein